MVAAASDRDGGRPAGRIARGGRWTATSELPHGEPAVDDREYGESCFTIVSLDIKGCDAALVHGSPCKDMSLDVRHAIESNKQGKLCRPQPQISHLNGLDWEVIVVKNDGHVGAMSWPHGKIIVFTGLLNHLETDDEIATLLAHEIAHVVARHPSESIMYKKWFPFPLKVHFIRRLEVQFVIQIVGILDISGFCSAEKKREERRDIQEGEEDSELEPTPGYQLTTPGSEPVATGC
ncbi:mitochondrial metalloendopeptidase OMA1-like [Hordeum vulgare]|nr:mitochondrial metalloendopeptidase OMA1-like [Hordeum vulgare]